jgi:hypothetical protein
MKLIRFGEPGGEKPGILLEDGTRLDASAFGADYDESFFGKGGVVSLQRWVRRNTSSQPGGSAGPAHLPSQQDRLPQLPRSRSGEQDENS